MKKTLLMIFVTGLLSCNSSTTAKKTDTSSVKKTTNMQTDAKDTIYKFVDASATLKFNDTSSKKNLTLEMRPIMFINQNPNMKLLRWYYVGGNWQNQNCPLTQTCTNRDINVCRQDPNTRKQIGQVPCGVTFTIKAVFWDKRTNAERNMSIEKTTCDCSKPNYNAYLGPDL